MFQMQLDRQHAKLNLKLSGKQWEKITNNTSADRQLNATRHGMVSKSHVMLSPLDVTKTAWQRNSRSSTILDRVLTTTGICAISIPKDQDVNMRARIRNTAVQLQLLMMVPHYQELIQTHQACQEMVFAFQLTMRPLMVKSPQLPSNFLNGRKTGMVYHLPSIIHGKTQTHQLHHRMMQKRHF